MQIFSSSQESFSLAKGSEVEASFSFGPLSPLCSFLDSKNFHAIFHKVDISISPLPSPQALYHLHAPSPHVKNVFKMPSKKLRWILSCTHNGFVVFPTILLSLNKTYFCSKFQLAIKGCTITFVRLSLNIHL